MDTLQGLHNAIYIWNGDDCAELEQNVAALKKVITGDVLIEQVNHFVLDSNLGKNVGVIFIATNEFKTVMLRDFLQILKLKGKLIISKMPESPELMMTNLKLNGFINSRIENGMIIAEKPNYEVGSSVPLSFGNSNSTSNSNVASVWKLEDNDVESMAIIDDLALLDEEDLKKPDLDELKVCATTGIRKACKNCSCGLSEELDAEEKQRVSKNTGEEPKSSCGSCYLGDAFRCSTCPFLGQPSFKPGEFIKLSDGHLKSDI